MEKSSSKLPSEVLNSRPEVIETQIGLVKGVIGSLPYVGPMLNELFFEIPNRINQARINETVKILAKKIKVLDESAEKQEYLKSEDFFDFSRQMLESCLKIKSEEKRNALANIYIDTIVKKAEYENSKSRLFMNFVVELSPSQMNILKFIEIHSEILQEIGEYSKFYEIYSKADLTIQLDKYEFKYYCNELESKALISFGAGLEDYESTAKVLSLMSHKESSVILTELGREFIDFIKEEQHPPLNP